jgi:hypothetical protein
MDPSLFLFITLIPLDSFNHIVYHIWCSWCCFTNQTSWRRFLFKANPITKQEIETLHCRWISGSQSEEDTSQGQSSFKGIIGHRFRMMFCEFFATEYVPSLRFISNQEANYWNIRNHSCHANARWGMNFAIFPIRSIISSDQSESPTILESFMISSNNVFSRCLFHTQKSEKKTRYFWPKLTCIILLTILSQKLIATNKSEISWMRILSRENQMMARKHGITVTQGR